MKFSTTSTFFALIVACATAFAPSTNSGTGQRMTSLNAEKSKALPFVDRPEILDGTYAGDAGFDPLGFARNDQALFELREAEIKHARLAMLAAAGWPLSELFDRKIASILNLEAALDASDRAPSVLNGGLEKIPILYWAGILATASWIEIQEFKKAQENTSDYAFPGDLGWDPLGLYPSDEAGQRRMQLAEIKNGRTAMIAITAFAFQEYAQKFAVVDATPMFFKPVSEVASEYGSSLGAEIVSQNVNQL